MKAWEKLIRRARRLDDYPVVMPLWEIRLGNKLALSRRSNALTLALLELADESPGFHARRVALRALRLRGAPFEPRVLECFLRALEHEQGWVRYDGAWGLADAGRSTPRILHALAKLAEGARRRPNIEDGVEVAKTRALETLRMLEIPVRPARTRDFGELMRMRHALWPDVSADDHQRELKATLSGKPRSTLPLTTFVACGQEKGLVGFVEVGLRSHADGCDPRRPVGFIEGWWVDPAHRKKDVGRRLIDAAKEWARTQGCREIASDTWQTNQESIAAHEALGFEVADRLVTFRCSL